jgi:hypothetical protein
MSTQLPSRLSDDGLIAEMNRLAGCERHDIASLLAHIAEFDERKLYLRLFYPSLYVYCVEVLKLATSDYIPADIKRAVWDRDGGRCAAHNRYEAGLAFGPEKMRPVGAVSERRASYQAGGATRASASSRITDAHINKVAVVTLANPSQRAGRRRLDREGHRRDHARPLELRPDPVPPGPG